MKLSKMTLAICALLFAGIANAQVMDSTNVSGAADSSATENPEKLTLSLADAQNYAIEHNRDLQTADIAIQKAEYAKWEALSNMLLQVNGSASYYNMCGAESEVSTKDANGNPITMSVPVNPYLDYGVKATATISGAQVIGYQISKMTLELQNITFKSSENDIKGAIATAYAGVLIAEKSAKLLNQTLENLKKLHQSTQKMVDVGMSEQTDADQLKIQVLTMENQISSLNRNIEMAYNGLRLKLGVDIKSDITLTDSVETLFNPTTAQELLNAEFNVEENYQIQQIQQKIGMAEKGVSAKKWSCAPSLTAFYNYGDKNYLGKDDQNTSPVTSTVGLTLTVPIFASGQRWSQIHQAQLDVQTAEIGKQTAIDGLLIQERQLKFNLNNAIETLQMQEENFELNKRVFNNMSEKYNYGVISSIELTTASTNLVTAQTNYINALNAAFSAQIELQKLLNTL